MRDRLLLSVLWLLYLALFLVSAAATSLAFHRHAVGWGVFHFALTAFCSWKLAGLINKGDS